MHTVYTYYEPIDVIDNNEGSQYLQNDLIDICRESWQLNGWELKVLSYNDAKQHPFYTEYSSTINKLPSFNPAAYEYHCFMRWLAMSQVGGGLMIDYDVMNLSLKSNDLFLQHDTLSIFQKHVPCVVYGTASQYLETCQAFCKPVDFEYLIEGRPHISDMIMIAYRFNNPTKCNKISYVGHYPDVAPLVHCSQSRCQQNNITKYKAMQIILNTIKHDIQYK